MWFAASTCCSWTDSFASSPPTPTPSQTAGSRSKRTLKQQPQHPRPSHSEASDPHEIAPTSPVVVASLLCELLQRHPFSPPARPDPNLALISLLRRLLILTHASHCRRPPFATLSPQKTLEPFTLLTVPPVRQPVLPALDRERCTIAPMTRPPCPYLASPSGQAWSLEFFPALTVPGSQNLQDRIIRLSSLEPGPAAISITWGAGGSTSERSLGLAEFIAKNVSGVEGILHLTCTNMEKEKVVEALDVSTPSPLHLPFSAASRRPEPPSILLHLFRPPKRWASRTSWPFEEVRSSRFCTSPNHVRQKLIKSCLSCCAADQTLLENRNTCPPRRRPATRRVPSRTALRTPSTSCASSGPTTETTSASESLVRLPSFTLHFQSACPAAQHSDSSFPCGRLSRPSP